MLRLTRRRHPLFDQNSFLLELFDLPLEGRHNACARRFDGALDKRVDLLFDLYRLLPQLFANALGLSQAHIPRVLEHHAGEFEEVLGGLQRLKKLFKVVLKRVTPNRFPVAFAALGLAEIIGMLLARLAGGPAGRKGRAAIIAQDEATQREVLTDVLPGRSFGGFPQALLNTLVCSEVDETFMVAFAERDAPFFVFQMPGIKHARQHFEDALIAYLAVIQVFREERLALKEAFHLHLSLKAATCITFKGLLQDRGNRFVADQYLPVATSFFKEEANRGRKRPIAILETSAHAVLCLLAIFLALVLRDGRQKILNQNGI